MRDENLIVSLTSFPARFDGLWAVIDCLKMQSVLPQKIILWLVKSEIESHGGVPAYLRVREDDLFEIRVVEESFRSHGKYYFTMKEFPNYSIITCDDDILYHHKTFHYLKECSSYHPNVVVANLASRVSYDAHGVILPYSEWRNAEEPYESKNLLQLGVGGVLYPPNSLSEYTLRPELFTKLAPLADDIWLNAMARIVRTPVMHSRNRLLLMPIKTESPSLTSVNNGESMNDKQLMAVRNFFSGKGYGDIFSES